MTSVSRNGFKRVVCRIVRHWRAAYGYESFDRRSGELGYDMRCERCGADWWVSA